MRKEVLFPLIERIDVAVSARDLVMIHDGSRKLASELVKIDTGRLPPDLNVAFIDALDLVQQWSKDIRGARLDLWERTSSDLKKIVVDLDKELSLEGLTKTINFWSNKRYTIVNQDLGHGAFGRTLLVRDEDIGLLQVAKVYEPNTRDELLRIRFFQFFKSEIALLHELNHRNVVRIFAAHLYARSYSGIILMEYINGRTLEKYISMYNPFVDDINDVFIQLIDAFVYLEEKKVIHRDIRPSNIMISVEGVAKVIDFGVGKIQRSKQSIDDSLASVIDRSESEIWPDELREREYDSRTDMFYLGEMFLRLLKSNKNCGDAFRYVEILRRMSNISHIERYKSFKELKNEIDRCNVVELVGDDEKEIYLRFANSIKSAITQRDVSSDIVVDEEVLTSGLDAVIERNIFEDYVSNPLEVFQLFIHGAFSYIRNARIETEAILNFRDWVRKSDFRRRRLIVCALKAKLNAIKIVKPIDLPF